MARQHFATGTIWKNMEATDVPGLAIKNACTTLNPKGHTTMLETWEAGTSEPPHSHPGDDVTVVLEGQMTVQFYKRDGGALVSDGAPLVLKKGDAGYIGGGRIHDASYDTACKLIYVHDGAFGFDAADQK
eukprot:CAMPEP_0205820226 /NCGR_PEP_ID=MMETSP0206-20130828/2839_1 /ASSEMBLY_ACC=CAM_ASM_000279 /TAXON_ID=36767 /ORGANISM="Euplotes focardii, Strain TN1" /LENGTH=129 /DNA_ID=CAMNT_0053114725 /DNA_START=87 /DNA_END=476 /DNA_ORIENTATION=-